MKTIVISVFVGVLSANPKFPISERRAITGALCAYYQVITGEDLHHRASVVIVPMTATTLEPVCYDLIVLVFPSCHHTNQPLINRQK